MLHSKRQRAVENFEPKSDEGIFLGYSDRSKAYRVFNHRTLSIMESAHVVIDESNQIGRSLQDDDEAEIISEQSMLKKMKRLFNLPPLYQLDC